MTSEKIYKLYVKKYFYCVSIQVIITVCIFPIIFYIIDPLQLFHKSWFNDDKLSPFMREQAAGIINNFEFDSIILGTSMLENTSSQEASQKLGGKFINISLSGSNFYERHFVLRKALKKNIHKVLYSLDSVYIGCNKERKDYSTSTWSYLYDDNRMNDFKIYFTKKYILTIFSPEDDLQSVDFDRPNAWFTNPYHSKRFGGLENWVKNVDNPQVNNFLLKALPELLKKLERNSEPVTCSDELKQKAITYINDNILFFCEKYPSTHFFLVFPPYYRYRYVDMKYGTSGQYDLHKFVIRYLVSRSQSLKNIHIYGFEDQSYPDDIRNYKDTGHYHYSFNSYMLDAIANDKHKLTVENVDTYLAEAERRLEAFDIAALNDEAQLLLRAQGTIQ